MDNSVPLDFMHTGQAGDAQDRLDSPYDLQNMDAFLNGIPSCGINFGQINLGAMDGAYTTDDFCFYNPLCLPELTGNREDFPPTAPLVESPVEIPLLEGPLVFPIYHSGSFNESDNVLCVSPSEISIQSAPISPQLSYPSPSLQSDYESLSSNSTSPCGIFEDDSISVQSLSGQYLATPNSSFCSPLPTDILQASSPLSNSTIHATPTSPTQTTTTVAPLDPSEEDSTLLHKLSQSLISNGFSRKVGDLPALLRSVRIATVLQFQARRARHGCNKDSDFEDPTKHHLKNHHFTSFFETKKVTRDHRSTSVHTCSFCTHSLNNRTQMIQHIKGNHIKYLPHWCDHDSCERRFARPADLNKHIEDKHSQASFPCPKCGNIYSNNRNLARHLKKPCGVRRRKVSSISISVRGRRSH